METKVTYSKLLNDLLESESMNLLNIQTFKRYSMFNTAYAAMQLRQRNMKIMPIATFKEWSNMGYSVKAGSKAIGLFVPNIKFKSSKEEDDEIRVYFNEVNRFFSAEQVHKQGVDYTLEDNVRLNFDLNKVLEKLDIKLVDYVSIDGNVHAYAIPNQKSIAISPVTNINKTRLVLHEITHVLLHNSESLENHELTIKELEAESVSHIVCNALGINEGADISRAYIKNFYKEKIVPENISNRIFKTVDTILAAIG